MADSGADAILEFLKRNNFARAEAALRSEIDKRPDLNGLMQDLSLKDKDLGSQRKASLTGGEVSKEKHIVKEVECETNGPDSKWEITSFDGEHNSEPIGAKSKSFMFSNGSEDNLLDLYTWRFDPGNGSADPSDNDDNNIKTENVKEYQVSSQSKIHDTERVNRKVGEETRVSFHGPVSNSRVNSVPNIEHVSKDDFVENPWSRNYEFGSVKTVFPFPEGDVSTSCNNNNNDNINKHSISGSNNNTNSNTTRVSEKEVGKRKTDNIRAAIKEQENEVLRALYFGKHQGNNELTIVSENLKEELPRLPPVKLKSTEKLSSLTWDEKHECDGPGPGQNLDADNAYHFGSFLDVPIDQEITSSGLKRPIGGSWRSISQGITEDTSDLVSGFATIGDGLSGAMDYPHEYWDSDEYDDDDDVGYIRQPIEDESWFLAHEIDYPSDNEKATIPNKTEDDNQTFAEEEDSCVSNDQYFLKSIGPIMNSDERNMIVQYDGDLMDEEELSLMSGDPMWQGFVPPTNELDMFTKPKMGNEGGARLPELNMDDGQHGAVRSIGVGINSDGADFGSHDVKSEKKKNVTSDSNKSLQSKSKSHNDKSNDSSTGKSSKEGEEDETDIAGSEAFRLTMVSSHGLSKQAHKEEEVKVADPIEEEDPGALLEDEEVVAVQEQVKQIKAQEEEYETFNLKIVHRKNRTGFEEDKNFHVVLNSVIAGRYHVSEYLGSAAFSKAIQAHDLHTGMDVCVKIIKNNKDFFDQSLDEIKLLKFVNKHDPGDKYHLLRLYDYFYYREHLLIVCELLKANLYEFQKFNRESGGEVYFTMPRLQSITIQCLEALQFLHSLGLIHCDLKPENILVKSYSRCEIKVIDLGSSCFETDHLCSYVQSRSYRAPEVILGLPYDKKIDIWSLGCILAELCTGNVLFQNDSPATLLARVIGIISPIDQDMLAKGRDTLKYFTKNHVLYERNQDTNRLECLVPKKTSLRHRLPMGDQGFIEFVTHLLEINPKKRPSAAEALKHPWLSYPYEPISS
ncbi:uncharacterized protein LOC143581987 isoform X2 [Bidens hawaiensis]|uniref:uncharacterized protein LOC143581987 isoform X2 n=1 Tax=Bidens hawaiensis TaxID=980011 RepID=UPI00404B0499